MPGLRRLRRARGRPVVPADARPPRARTWCSSPGSAVAPVPVLPGHLRNALDPRPSARDRDRAGRHAAGPVGLGGHRRRRRALDRRQPPDPRAAPQRQPQDPAVQQPDLRADQGPVLADVGGGEDHQVHADGLGGPPVQPDLAGAGRRGDVRGPALDSDRKGLTAVLQAAAAHRGTALVEIFQDCPIFNDGSFDVLRRGEEAASRVIPLQHGEPIRFGPAGGPEDPDGLGTYAVVQDGFRLRVAKANEIDDARRSSCTTRRPRARVRPVAAVGPGPDPHRHGDLPQRGPADLRRRRPGAGAAGRRQGAVATAGRTCRPCSTAATPGPSSAERRASSAPVPPA